LDDCEGGVAVDIGVSDGDTVMSAQASGTTPKNANVAAASVLLVYIGNYINSASS